MTWTQQVWHVLRRDLTRTQLLLWLYVELLIIAVARALEWPPAMHAAIAPVGIVVTICAIVAAVRVVLFDGTTRADAFWAVQPLQASAVAASKLAYTMLLLALYTGAILVVRSAWHLSPLFVDGAGIDVYPVLILLLLGMALVASVFTTITSVGVVAAGTLSVVVFARFVLDIPQWSLPPVVWWSLVIALALGCGIVIVRRYQVRATTLVSRGAALGSGVIAMCFPVFGMPSWRGAHERSSDPARTLDSIALTLPVTTMPSCAGQQLTIPIDVGAPRGWRVSLMRPTVDVTRDDGSMISLSAPDWMQLAGGEGPLLPTNLDRTRLRVLGGDGDLPNLSTAVVFRVPAAEADRTCGHVARLAMRMWVKTATGVELMRVPLDRTTRTDTSGYRARILSTDVQASRVSIRVRLSGMRDESARDAGDSGWLDFALFNAARGELLKLERSDESDFSSSTDLPGMRHWTSHVTLVLRDRVGRLGDDLASWRDSSVLLITAPKDEGRGWLRSPVATVP